MHLICYSVNFWLISGIETVNDQQIGDGFKIRSWFYSSQLTVTSDIMPVF